MFQIAYGMHPRGISELRDLRRDQFLSERVEDFATEMRKLHDQIKGQLQESSQTYKSQIH
jgi:hypothetical protein